MTTSMIFWLVSAAAAVLAGLSGVAEKRRDRRKNLDRPGWVPWTLIQVLAVLIVFIAAALAVMV